MKKKKEEEFCLVWCLRNVFPVGSRDLGMELRIATSSNKELPLLLAPSSPLFMVSAIGPDCNPVRHRKLKQLPMLAQSEVTELQLGPAFATFPENRGAIPV